MLPYWLFFGLFAVGAFISRADPNRDKRLGALAIAWIVITLMVGLRWEVGTDWASYVGWWDRAGANPLDRYLRATQSDPGFYSLMWSLRNVGAPYWMLNLFFAAVLATGLVQFSRAQVNPWLAILIAVPWLVIVIGMSGLRQATAIGLVLLAIRAFQRRESLRFLGSMALAASCHASAVLLLPLVGLSFARSRLAAVLLIMITMGAGYYFLTRTFIVYSDRYFLRVEESAGTLFRVAMIVFPALVYLAYRRHFPAEPHERLLWRNLSLVGLLALPLYFVVQSSTALDRVLLYLFPLQMYVLSAIPSILGGRRGKALITFLIIAYVALQLFVFMNYAVNRDFFLPYRTIFARQAT